MAVPRSAAIPPGDILLIQTHIVNMYMSLPDRSLEAGVRWAAAMQSELLALPWPESALEWGAAAEV